MRWTKLIAAAALMMLALTPILPPAEEQEPEPTETPKPAPRPETWTRYEVGLRDDLQRYVQRVCRDYEVAPCVVLAMIEIESKGTFKANIEGDGGDSIGLMQIQPRWHEKRIRDLGVTDLMDPEQNILVGVDFLAEMLEITQGDYDTALSYYNSGSATGGRNYAHAVLCRSEQILEGSMIEIVRKGAIGDG